MDFNDLVDSFAKQYLGEDVLSSLTRSSPDSNVNPVSAIAPLIIAPIASPFLRGKRSSGFPMPSDYKKYPTLPPERRGVTGTYEDQGGDDGPETIELEDLPSELSAYLTKTPTGKINMFGETIQAGPQITKGVFGTNFAIGPGDILGRLTTAAGPLGASAGMFGQKNLENLEYIAAMAALGKQGYGVGLVNGQVAGVTPEYAIIQGITTRLNDDQRNEITDKFTGKSGPMSAGIKAMQQSFSDNFTPTAGTKAYEKTIMNSTLNNDLKSEMLGFNPSFRGNRFSYEQTVPDGTYKQFVTGKQYMQDVTSSSDFRGNTISNPSFNFGLETDVAAQDNQITPTAINVGIDMGNISGVPTGVNVPTYVDNDSGGNDGGGSDPSSPSSSDMGFSTAYGGRINKAYGGGENTGFTSKTPDKITIQGVGLIKPEETFLKTDTVRDRYDLEARENDFIINGPSSEQFKKPILAFINQAENNLKNKGVDINVGKPTIPVSKQVPLLVASSENYIPKEYIEAFNPNNPEEGYRILEAMNNVGKPEVTRLKSQIDQPTDQSKYQANKGMRANASQQGFLSSRPKLNLTGPNIDKTENAFVPGISDEPIEMNLDQQRFFGDYEFGDIKKAIKRTEILGYEKNPYIFTGYVPEGDALPSSAFGPMQITTSLINDFKKRSKYYAGLNKEEKKYLDSLALQGRDKINNDRFGTIVRGSKPNSVKTKSSKFYGKNLIKFEPLGSGIIDPKLHKKYYNKIADVILMHKLNDHETIEKALGSYGEGANYSQKVLDDLLDIMQGVEPPTKVTPK